MAIFTNQATLTYNNTTVNSNVVSGEILEALAITKTAVGGTYNQGDKVTYVVNIQNTGAVPYTNLTVTDNLGEYTFGTDTRVPLDYEEGSVLLLVNGTVQTPAPTVASTNPLTVTGITVPANSNITLIYEARANGFAPLGTGNIVNTVTATGAGLTEAITATETVTPDTVARLNITKSLTPQVVTDNSEITYTFLVENFGAEAVEITDNAQITDTFDPILTNIVVTYNGTPWAQGTNYDYNPATGVFTTVPGQITVPAATFAQDPVTGEFTATPGTATIVVRGTV